MAGSALEADIAGVGLNRTCRAFGGTRSCSASRVEEGADEGTLRILFAMG
jgi:hypothetical protein